MATYIVLGTFTQKGVEGVKDVPQRRALSRERAKALGLTFEADLTLCAYDLVWVLDAPNDEAVATWVLGIGRSGNLRTQTLRAFNEADADPDRGRAPTAALTPPGGLPR